MQEIVQAVGREKPSARKKSEVILDKERLRQSCRRHQSCGFRGCEAKPMGEADRWELRHWQLPGDPPVPAAARSRRAGAGFSPGGQAVPAPALRRKSAHPGAPRPATRPQRPPLPTRGRRRAVAGARRLRRTGEPLAGPLPVHGRQARSCLAAPGRGQPSRRGGTAGPLVACEPPDSPPWGAAAISRPRRGTAGGGHSGRGQRRRAVPVRGGRHFEHWHARRAPAPPGRGAVSGGAQPPAGSRVPAAEQHRPPQELPPPQRAGARVVGML